MLWQYEDLWVERGVIASLKNLPTSIDEMSSGFFANNLADKSMRITGRNYFKRNNKLLWIWISHGLQLIPLHLAGEGRCERTYW